jgi:hypothetical protein
MVNALRGALVEYTPAFPPLVFVFDFNPQAISRTRTLTLRSDSAPGRRGYDFATPADVPRVAHGATVQAESFTVDVLVDCTDLMDKGDPIAATIGIQPQLDTLREMQRPKVQAPEGVQVLTGLGAGTQGAFQPRESASVLLFAWGPHVLPVFLTTVKVDEQAHLPTLCPYRATVSLTMQVIESDNPFWRAAQLRQVAGARIGGAQSIAAALGAVL